MATKSQLLKGILEGCILAIIAHGETYGYELTIKLADSGFNFVSEGSIYPVLLRLQKAKWIVGTMKKSPSGPDRKYYKATQEGIVALAEFKNNWQTVKTPVDRLLGEGTE